MILAMPFDFVKTQAQKDNPLNEQTLKIIKNYILEKRVNVLYIGWQFKMMQYIFQSFFTVFTLDRLEMKSKELH